MATKTKTTSKTLADVGAEHKALGSMEQADAKSGVKVKPGEALSAAVKRTAAEAKGKPSEPTSKPGKRATAKPSDTETKPSEVDDTKRSDEDLRAERLQLNNRLSGLKTRRKRTVAANGSADVLAGLEARIDQLTARRAEIGETLKTRASA